MARRIGVPVRGRTRVPVRITRVFLDGVMVPRNMVSFVGDMARIEGFMVPRAMIRDTVRMKRKARMERMARRKRMATTKRKLEEEEEEEARMILSEDERKKKLVYIFTYENDRDRDEETIGDLKVVAFDPHEDEAVLESHHGSRFIDKTSITEAMPPNLRELRNYQFAALGSKLYFIGGVHSNLGLGSKRASNRVFTFDMASQVWDEVPCMEVKRALSTVVTYENKIYVFGYSRRFRATRKPEQWAEFFDPQTNAWNWLPGLPAPKELRERAGYMNVVGTALEDQKKILLCIQNVDVYSYSLVNQSWCHETSPSLTNFSARWSNTVAVVKDTVFWNYFGNIFAFDFQPEVLDLELKCTIPNAREMFGIPVSYNKWHTYLVYAGNGKLCLVHDNQHGDGEYSIRCHTFQLRRSRTKKHFDLHYEGSASYQSEPPCGSVFAMAMI